MAGFWSRHSKNECIAALKAKLDEKMTSEPTKPERFAGLRGIDFMEYSTPNLLQWRGGNGLDVTQEIKDILAAFDEADKIMQKAISYVAYSALDARMRKWVDDYGNKNIPPASL